MTASASASTDHPRRRDHLEPQATGAHRGALRLERSAFSITSSMVPSHVERLLGHVVELALGDIMSKPRIVSAILHVAALEAGELLGDVERLREEALNQQQRTAVGSS